MTQWWASDERLVSRSWAIIRGRLELINDSANISSRKMFLFMRSTVNFKLSTYPASSYTCVHAYINGKSMNCIASYTNIWSHLDMHNHYITLLNTQRTH